MLWIFGGIKHVMGTQKEISHCDSKKIHVEFVFHSQYFTKANNVANDWRM